MTNKRWNYSGDINLCEGGLYWRESGYSDHVYAVRVTPCSDAGGPDNQFWIERGSIFLGNPAHIASALECSGIDPAKATRADIVLSVDAYMGLDGPDMYMVQIGARAETAGPGWGGAGEPDFILRGNASLRRFIRREFLDLSR